MTDTFEHSKPYNLVGRYQENSEPSEFTAPYDLYAVYDENATWNTDYIFAQDFDAQAFGEYLVTYTQNISVIGCTALDFGQPTLHNSNKFIQVSGIYDAQIGTANLINKNKWLNLTGFNSQAFGTQSIYNLTKYINLNNHGFLTQTFGTVNIWNFNKEIKVTGFNTQIFGTQSKVYNLRQYLNLNSRGINSALYGNAYLQGGVKYVLPSGFNSSALTNPKVVNTKASQYIGLSGIPSLAVPSPNVSPRIIYAKSQIATLWGNALVQFPPHPKGFVATSYGVAWISHSPRYLEPNYIDAFNSGYPTVFDPTQKIGVTGVNTVIPGGVFGDISIRNTRRIIKVSGLYAQSFSDWGVVESNLRNITSKGLDNQNFGSNAIRNKTPFIAPIGINAFAGLNSAIGYRIRTIKPSGFYQPKFGQPTLTKTPELKPSGNNQNIFGSTWISHKTRSIYAGLGRESLLFGEINVWHFTRYLKPTGILNDEYGTPCVEHGRRVLLTKGSTHSVYGNNTWISYAVRFIAPLAIDYPKIPNHRVGGTQNIQPFGYVATLFGSRIIPESQSIYPQGFINPFGLTIVDLWKKYIKPNGFLTTGQEGGHRFGTHKFWNLRQYIQMYYDVDSGLTPPKWTGWTAIANKNKTIATIGSNLAHVAEPFLRNNARVISPSLITSTQFGQAMIAGRVRYLRLQGMEAPYMSGWSRVFNDAFVIIQKGENTQAFGQSSIVNTRIYLNRIGNFESQSFGMAMIDYRIRTLSFEPRYTIGPTHIPIHRVDLHTRYIEEVGRFDDHQAFGHPALSIHWKIITPRWTHRDFFGDARLRNVTPELFIRGRNSEEFGQASIRTQWRELLHLGSETVAWGRSEIAFRDRQFSVNGFTQWNVPRPRVTKTGIPPYFPQYIWLDAVEIDGKQNNGHGIDIPEKQVSLPSVKSNVVFPDSFIASRYGSHHTQSNGILVQPGLQELSVGSPFVGLKNRNIIVTGIDNKIEVSKPRLSPHTIYAVMEASSQAKQNHELRNLHYVNSSSGDRPPGEVFGRTTITLRHRKLSVGLGNQSRFDSGHRVALRRRYISLTDFGFRSQRMGIHVVGPFNQGIIQFESTDMQLFGRASLSIPYGGAYYIRPRGMDSATYGRANIELFHRTIRVIGNNHTQMGTRKSGDTPFMWQGLHVGELVKGNYGGFASEVFGTASISLWVRDVGVKGFDAFLMEYDNTQFDKRMRVIRQNIPLPVVSIKSIGFDHLAMGVPNIKPAVHYIRPDGNADQYRKGAF